MFRTLAAATMIALATTGADAGAIEAACLRSDRQAATRALCDCIGSVADQLLSGSDQRRGAKFFSDPAKAQKVRQSDRASDEAFWLRYKAFGTQAESLCAPPA